MRVVSKLDGCSDSTRRSYRAVKFNNRHKVTRLILLRKKRTGARWLANFRFVRLSLACTVKMSTSRIATCGDQYCPPFIFFWSNPKKQSIVSIINENITLTFLSRYHKNFIEFSVYRKIYVKNEMKQIQ